MSQSRIYPARFVEDSIESLFAHHGVQRPTVYWLFLIGLCLVLVCLPLIRVDVSIGAPGSIKPVAERLLVQVPVDGHVSELHVRENQQVKAGQVLLVLTGPVMQEKLAYNKSQAAEVNAQLADLALLTHMGTAVLEKRNDSGVAVLGQMSPSEFTTRAYLGQYEYFRSLLEAAALQEAKARLDHRRVTQLHARGLIADQEHEQSAFTLETAATQLQQIVRQHLSRWQADRLEKESRRHALDAEERQLVKQLELYTIRAPADGAILGLAGLSVGTYLPAGSRIGEISPSGDLMVEAFLRPKDVGFVRVGQQTNVQVDSFPHTQWGMLAGTVQEVSHDSLHAGQQGLFRVLVSVPCAELRSSSGVVVKAGKGMTVNARFIMTRRSLWELLYQSVGRWLDPTEKQTP